MSHERYWAISKDKWIQTGDVTNPIRFVITNLISFLSKILKRLRFTSFVIKPEKLFLSS